MREFFGFVILWRCLSKPSLLLAVVVIRSDTGFGPGGFGTWLLIQSKTKRAWSEEKGGTSSGRFYILHAGMQEQSPSCFTRRNCELAPAFLVPLSYLFSKLKHRSKACPNSSCADACCSVARHKPNALSSLQSLSISVAKAQRILLQCS